MNSYVTIGLILMAFVIGYVLRGGVGPHTENVPMSARDHWNLIERHNREMVDPANERIIDGMHGIEQQTDIMPSLAALVSAGEIQHLDLVFPNVANGSDTNAIWMEFVNAHDDIIYAEGNPRYVGFAPSGVQPLHLNLWFRETASDKLRGLIQSLEKHSQDKSRGQDKSKGTQRLYKKPGEL